MLLIAAARKEEGRMRVRAVLSPYDDRSFEICESVLLNRMSAVAAKDIEYAPDTRARGRPSKNSRTIDATNLPLLSVQM